MVAAIADGPLPIGDILLAAVTASTLIVLATNWSTVSPLWNSIVQAFTNAFSTSVSNITSAFGDIKAEAEVNSTISAPSISYSGKLVTVAGTQYNCSTRADQLTETQRKKGTYYVAVLWQGYVWVDATKPFTSGFAKAIILGNNFYVGVWANTRSDARGVAGGNFAIWHDTHDSSEGYFYHFHHRQWSSSHAWYLYDY